MKMRMCAVAAFLALTACATAPEPPLSASAAAAMPTDIACELYAISDSPETKQNLHAALDKRGDISSEEWDAVDSGQVRMGLGRCAVLAMFGKPDVINEAGSHIEVLGYNSGRFISFQDGRVVNFQVPN